jgi:ParB family chromosome partitioning protein
VIARVKSEAQRQVLLEAAITEDLSLAQIKERITKINNARVVDHIEAASLKSRVKAAYRLVEKSNIWEDSKKQKRLEKLLAELESLASQS